MKSTFANNNAVVYVELHILPCRSQSTDMKQLENYDYCSKENEDSFVRCIGNLNNHAWNIIRKSFGNCIYITNFNVNFGSMKWFIFWKLSRNIQFYIAVSMSIVNVKW